MDSPLLLLLLIVLSISSLPFSQSKLSLDYYKNKCPDFPKIMMQIIPQKQMATPTTAAGVLRLFFHDCMIKGCDASILISSNPFNIAERDEELNQALPGDAFEIITRLKTALEIQCPGIVSCADILATTTRDLVSMVGGPFYKVRLGRKDGTVSNAGSVAGNIASSNMTVSQLISLFKSKGLTVQEMVALSGAHTIGFSHCKEFAKRLYNFSATTPTDPSMNSKYAERLKALCINYTKDSTMSGYNDVMTPGKFDNMYYRNLKRGLGLLATDQALAQDERTRPIVELYAANETAFFNDFSRAMEKVSIYKIKTGRKGEVRRRCDQVNNLNV